MNEENIYSLQLKENETIRLSLVIWKSENYKVISTYSKNEIYSKTFKTYHEAYSYLLEEALSYSLQNSSLHKVIQ